MSQSSSPHAWWYSSACALLWVHAAACFAPGSQVGELGEAGFSYVCDDAADAACDAGTPRGLPDVALGAELGIALSSESAARPRSPTPFLVETRNTVEYTVFRADIAGFAVVLASDRYDEAGDLVHVRIRRPSSVHVQRQGTSGYADIDVAKGLDLVAGTTLALRAAPFADDGAVLAGALPTSWTVEDDKVLGFDGNARDNVVTLRAIAPGTTQVRVTQGDLSVSVPVTVGVAQ